MRIIDNLTAKEKALIRRDYLLANFKGAFGSNAIASLLLDFAPIPLPETLADIKSGHNVKCAKRHKRIEDEAVLLAQEKAAQEPARPEEPQAETDGQTDAQTRGGRRVIVTKAGAGSDYAFLFPITG